MPSTWTWTPTIAHRVSLAEVESGLAPVGSGGVVEARRFVDRGAFPWFKNQLLALRARADWPTEVPKASVLCDTENFAPLVARLLQIGIEEPIDDCDVFSVDGVKVLFGVSNGKEGTPTGDPFFRFIMNFVPINSYLHELIGDTYSLPDMAQRGHFVVHGDEIVPLYCEDQKASSYLYEVAAAWRPFCVFRWKAPGWALGIPQRRWSFFTERVAPMRFAGSVPIMQGIGQMHANGPSPQRAGIRLTVARGDRAFPLTLPFGEREVQHIYLDSWESFLICPESQRPQREGHPRRSQDALREAWARAGVLRSGGKAITGVVAGVSLGAAIDGLAVEHGPTPDRVAETALYNRVAAASESVSL